MSFEVWNYEGYKLIWISVATAPVLFDQPINWTTIWLIIDLATPQSCYLLKKRPNRPDTPYFAHQIWLNVLTL